MNIKESLVISVKQIIKSRLNSNTTSLIGLRSHETFQIIELAHRLTYIKVLVFIIYYFINVFSVYS